MTNLCDFGYSDEEILADFVTFGNKNVTMSSKVLYGKLSVAIVTVSLFYTKQ